MNKIRKLPAQTISKIAAGEVVERPSSIVKELLENSIDAGADKVTIIVKNGGIDFISVEDDGSGITKDDLLNSIEIHATSKLTDISELESIGTLGFRGEALASVNAVSDLEIVSATDNSGANKLSGGKITPAGRDKGTTITVRNLFRTVPARRKFLKSIRTEESKIRDLIKQFAILLPKVEFSYIVDEKVIINAKPSDRRVRINSIVKIPLNDLIEVKSRSKKADSLKIQGYIVHPRSASKRAQHYIYVNGRTIKSHIISAAIKKGYGNKLPPELNPAAFIEITLDPKIIDINVHPRKEEIKFSDESMIFKCVFSAVDRAVGENMRNEFEKRFMPEPITKTSPSRLTAPTQSNNSSQTSKPSQSYKVKSDSISQAMDFSRNILNDASPVSYAETIRPTSKNSKYLQILDTYILFEKNSTLLVLDQHAADERVNYEKITRKHNNGELESLPLLVPGIVSVEKSVDQGAITEIIKALEATGFKMSYKKNTSTIEINRIPLLLEKKLDYQKFLDGIITDLTENTSGDEIDMSWIEKGIDRVCATIACHSSIRAGDKLERVQIEKLLSDLWECENPYTCPHGRPIVWELGKSELEKKFMRQK